MLVTFDLRSNFKWSFCRRDFCSYSEIVCIRKTFFYYILFLLFLFLSRTHSSFVQMYCGFWSPNIVSIFFLIICIKLRENKVQIAIYFLFIEIFLVWLVRLKWPDVGFKIRFYVIFTLNQYATSINEYFLKNTHKLIVPLLIMFVGR